jgi:hypothetical protein
MNHVIKNTNQHVDVKKFGENWDLISKSKKKKYKSRQAAKKEKLDYNPFSFLKY